MQKENYERHLWIGLILTLLVIGGIAFAWFTEADRISAAESKLKQTSTLRGRELFVENCTSCHGTRGEGGLGPALNNKTLLKTASDDVLFMTIHAGRPNTTMPAWGQNNGGPLTDEDIRQIVMFLRAWEPTAPEVKTDVKPSAARGATIFAGSCALCHGEDGKGGKTATAPAINDLTRLGKLDDAWYRQTIANGRPAKGMPTWGTVLSPAQIEDVVALIGAWRKSEPVIPETTVAEILNSAVFSLSQGDSADALFYVERAKKTAFGPALPRFDPILDLIKKDQLNPALAELDKLSKEWPLGNDQDGKKVYGDACSGCHGADGQGGVGRKLKPSEFIQKSTNAELLQLVLKGREGTAMRAFSGKLTEQQIANVIAYLRAWQK